MGRLIDVADFDPTARDQLIAAAEKLVADGRIVPTAARQAATARELVVQALENVAVVVGHLEP